MQIYLITNLVNGKYYVGQTVQKLHRRWKNHLQSTKNDRSHYLKNAILKYGPHNFKIETLCECPDLERLNICEQFFIWFLASNKSSFGYNTDSGGKNAIPNESVRLKMSAAQKGRKHSPETIEKIRLANIGRKHTQETKLKMRSVLRKKLPPRTKEHREKQSESQRGKKFSDERRQNISKSLKGRKLPQEQKDKIKATLNSNKNNPPTQKQLNYWNSRKGKKLGSYSDERKQSMKDGWKKRLIRLSAQDPE